MSFLRAVNTGHAGSLTSIHADSPEGALEQLALIVMQGAAACRGRTSCIMRAASSTLWCNWSGGRGGGGSRGS
jgi:type IV secretory pathway ATPase VirB11/archaellum biosynthesis ATPase